MLHLHIIKVIHYQVVEAYGQAECSSCATISIPGDPNTGHVGVPLPCNIIKLVDIPEMNYYSKNGEGEVCVAKITLLYCTIVLHY